MALIITENQLVSEENGRSIFRILLVLTVLGVLKVPEMNELDGNICMKAEVFTDHLQSEESVYAKPSSYSHKIFLD